MSTTRIPTTVARCGCPYDPDYDEGHLSWHLTENHIPVVIESLKRDICHMGEELAELEYALPHSAGSAGVRAGSAGVRL